MVIVVVLILGVFIGAFFVELMNRDKTNVVSRAGSKAKHAASDFRRGFKEGYRGGPRAVESVDADG